MKKIFFAMTALAVMTGCSNDELVEVTPKQAIAFGNAFVDNATRAIDPSITSTSINSFNVYGTVEGTDKDKGEGKVNIFNGVEVNKDQKTSNDIGDDKTHTWWYSADKVQYWIKGNNYDFAAVVNGDVTTDVDYHMPTTIAYTANYEQQKDLLYSEESISGYDGTTEVVKFTFKHLLAKVKFTFNNTITTNDASNYYQYKVTNLKFVNTYKSGDYNVASQDWTVTGNRLEVPFGNITNATVSSQSSNAIAVGDGPTDAVSSATSHNEMLVVPHTYKHVDANGENPEVKGLKVSYTIQTLLNGKVINSEDVEVEIVDEVKLEAGHAYNFIISKGNPGSEIKFALETVDGWKPIEGGETKPKDVTITVTETPTPEEGGSEEDI